IKTAALNRAAEAHGRRSKVERLEVAALFEPGKLLRNDQRRSHASSVKTRPARKDHADVTAYPAPIVSEIPRIDADVQTHCAPRFRLAARSNFGHMPTGQSIAAHLIVGARPEPYLAAVLESIAGLCAHVVVNDNSGTIPGPNDDFL